MWVSLGKARADGARLVSPAAMPWKLSRGAPTLPCGRIALGGGTFLPGDGAMGAMERPSCRVFSLSSSLWGASAPNSGPRDR